MLSEAPMEERCVETIRVPLRTSELMRRYCELHFALKPEMEKGNQPKLSDLNYTHVYERAVEARMKGEDF